MSTKPKRASTIPTTSEGQEANKCNPRRVCAGLLDEEQSIFLVAGEQVTHVDDKVEDSTANDLHHSIWDQVHLKLINVIAFFDSDVDEGRQPHRPVFMTNHTS
ncbi:hypothetical protein Tco_1353313 [Tanacetum coccineum]